MLYTDYSKALLQRLSSSLNAIHRLQQSITAAVIIKSERYTQTTAKHYCSGYHQVWTLYTEYSKALLQRLSSSLNAIHRLQQSITAAVIIKSERYTQTTAKHYCSGYHQVWTLYTDYSKALLQRLSSSLNAIHRLQQSITAAVIIKSECYTQTTAKHYCSGYHQVWTLYTDYSKALLQRLSSESSLNAIHRLQQSITAAVIIRVKSECYSQTTAKHYCSGYHQIWTLYTDYSKALLQRLSSSLNAIHRLQQSITAAVTIKSERYTQNTAKHYCSGYHQVWTLYTDYSKALLQRLSSSLNAIHRLQQSITAAVIIKSERYTQTTAKHYCSGYHQVWTLYTDYSKALLQRLSSESSLNAIHRLQQSITAAVIIKSERYTQTTAKHYCSGYHQVWTLYTDYSKALLQRLSSESSLNAIHRLQQSITAAVIIKSERYTQTTAKHYCSGYHQVWTLYTDYSKALLQRLSSSLNAIHRLQQSITAAVIIKSERYTQTTAKHYCSGYHQVWTLYTDYSKALLQRLSSSLNAIHRLQQSITAAVIIKSERYTQTTAKHYCSGYHQVWTLYTDYSKALLQRLSSSLNAIHRLQQSITAAVIIKSERYTQTTAKHYCSGYHQVWTLYTDYSKALLQRLSSSLNAIHRLQQSITAAVIIKSERYTQTTAKHYCSGYHQSQVWMLYTDYSKALLQRLSSSLNAIHRLQQSITAAVIIKSERYTQTTAKHYCSGYHQVWTLYTDYSKALLQRLSSSLQQNITAAVIIKSERYTQNTAKHYCSGYHQVWTLYTEYSKALLQRLSSSLNAIHRLQQSITAAVIIKSERYTQTTAKHYCSGYHQVWTLYTDYSKALLQRLSSSLNAIHRLQQSITAAVIIKSERYTQTTAKHYCSGYHQVWTLYTDYSKALLQRLSSSLNAIHRLQQSITAAVIIKSERYTQTTAKHYCSGYHQVWTLYTDYSKALLQRLSSSLNAIHRLQQSITAAVIIKSERYTQTTAKHYCSGYHQVWTLYTDYSKALLQRLSSSLNAIHRLQQSITAAVIIKSERYTQTTAKHYCSGYHQVWTLYTDYSKSSL